MSETRSIPVVTKRKAALVTSTSIYNGFGSLTILLLFLLAVVTSAHATAAATTTTLTSPTASATYASGASVTLTATVSPSAATGTVTFKSGTTTLGTCTLASGTCSSAYTTLPVGTDSLTAAYTATATYAASTSTAVSVTVTSPTTTTLAASAASTALGSTETLTATVTPTAATGTVTFYKGTTSLGTGTLASGKATLAVSTLPLGANSLTAVYAGSSPYLTSTSAATTVTVVAGTASTTTLTTSSATPASGSSLTLTATVTPSAATGSVTFYDGSTSLGTGTIATGKATLAVTTLAVGAHSITATYGGSATDAPSTSSASSVTVTSSTTTALTAKVGGAAIPAAGTPSGSSVLLTATVSPAAATGSVTFMNGSTSLGTGTLSSGVATLAVTTLPIASNSVTAVYAGNGTYLTSTSAAATVKVIAAPATTTLSVPAGPYYYGSSLTFSAAVTPSSSTGSVTFYDGSTSLGTGPLSAGSTPTATLTISTLAVGSHSITASYTANGSTATSASTSIPIQATTTAVALHADANGTQTTLTTTAPGTSFTLNATVTAAVGSAAVNGGHVSFYDSSTLLGTVLVNSSGVAAPLIVNTSGSPLAIGKHYLLASYGGVYNGTGAAQFGSSLSSSAPVSIIGATALTITASSPSVAYGAAVPTITPTYSGWVNGDSPTSLTTAPTCTTTYTTSSAPGSTPTTSCSGAKDPNYTITYVNGSVTVTPASQTIGHWFTSTTVYGTPVTLSATSTSGLPVAYSVISGPGTMTNATTLKPSGVGVITVGATVAGNADYAAVTVPVQKTVTVYQAPLLITASSPAVTYGAAVPVPTPIYSPGLVNGDTVLTTTPTCKTSYTATSVLGSYNAYCYGAADANYSITYASGAVTVSKASPTVTAASTGTNPYGTLLSTTNWPITTCSAVNPNNGASVAGTCSWTNSGSSPQVGGVAQPVTFTPSSSTYYTTGTGSASVTVTKASLTVGTVPTSTSVPFGSQLNLSRLSGGTATSSVTHVAVPGSYSWASGDPQALVIGSNPEDVTFTPTSTGNFNTLTTSTKPVAVSVTKGTPTGITWPTSSSCNNTFTYGQALSSCSFSNGSATTPAGGTFNWTNPATKPGVGSNISESVTYTPAGPDQTNYTTATGTVKITVQAVPATVNSWPSASSITYGQMLSSSILSGGSASVPGAFAWSSSDNASTTMPGGGSTSYSVTFTPTNTSLYGAVTSGQVVAVTVNKATPTGITWPMASSIPIAGEALSTSTLSPASGNATGINSSTIPGSFGWAAPGTLATAGTSSYSASFTPTDTVDYNSVSGPVNVSVNTCGMQDDANLANPVNSTAAFVFIDGQTPSLSGAFPFDVEGINESAICAANAEPGDVGADVTITQPFITSGAMSTSQTDSSNDGTNSAVLAYGTTAAGQGATITINDDGQGDPGSISTSANSANAVFASYGGTVNITDTILSTSGNYSHGLVATNGGTLIINNVQASTSGNNSAVIAAGIGSTGNSVTVNGGNYASSGTRSSGIRAAGNGSTVNVNDGDSSGTVISAGSAPVVVVEGGNTVSITSSGNATSLFGTLGDNHGIYLYQGTLGDATAGTTNFNMTGGSISYSCDAYTVTACATGVLASDQNVLATLFSVANTTATITLTDVTVTNTTNSNGNGILLTAAGLNSGTTGSNGGNVTFNAFGETLTGDIIVDGISTATLSLAADSSSVPSTLIGAINTANSGAATVSLTLDATSTWVVGNGPSYLTTLNNAGSNNISCQNSGQCTVYVNGVELTGVN